MPGPSETSTTEKDSDLKRMGFFVSAKTFDLIEERRSKYHVTQGAFFSHLVNTLTVDQLDEAFKSYSGKKPTPRKQVLLAMNKLSNEELERLSELMRTGELSVNKGEQEDQPAPASVPVTKPAPKPAPAKRVAKEPEYKAFADVGDIKVDDEDELESLEGLDLSGLDDFPEAKEGKKGK
jgi:hypothetical protein